MMHRLERYFQQIWYEGRRPPVLLAPLEKLYQHVVQKKRRHFLQAPGQAYAPGVPVIIVGNITIGGTGKTPLTLFLIEAFKAKGLQVGVISRGYGGRAKHYPVEVDNLASASDVGDEPLMMHLRSGVPVVVDPDRVAAAKYLEQHYSVDIIISDDGLQHYGLDRSVEIVVMDATRGVGNGRCLPNGPLREPVERLADVHYLVVNGGGVGTLSPVVRSAMGNDAACYAMQIEAQGLVPLYQSSIKGGVEELANFSDIESANALRELRDQEVYGVAGIGNPARFFSTLREFGCRVIEKPFPDHYQYTSEDFTEIANRPVVMTEKDAVKVKALGLTANHGNSWYLKVSASINPALIDDILQQLFPHRFT